VVTPGDVITEEEGYMRCVAAEHTFASIGRFPHSSMPPYRGHGTYAEDNVLLAAVAGVVERVNKVISVRPLRTR
jgi:exosome complex RNA-binding protein Rrp4